MAYIAVRTECEAAIKASGLNATGPRPWYVLGPGHWWPYALLPFYKIAELLPPTRDGARRLGLVTLERMTTELLGAVENPASGTQGDGRTHDPIGSCLKILAGHSFWSVCTALARIRPK
jgi:uncharacterized protein YbjT (DUF2867 family)